MSEAAGVIDEETFRRIVAAVKRIEAMLPHRRIAGFNPRLGGDAADGTFVVDLAETDGDGSVDDPFVYSAWLEGAAQETVTPLGTELTPIKPRLPVDATAAATKGLAYYDATGAFKLIEAFEAFGHEEACPEEEEE